MAKDDADRAARLLLKALDSLPEREKDLVLRNLLAGHVGSMRGHAPFGLSTTTPPMSFPEGRVGMQVARQMEQPLLVRLPADLHARFRRWATGHGFSMASVVRGLVERFLEDQEGRGRQGSGPARG